MLSVETYGDVPPGTRIANTSTTSVVVHYPAPPGLTFLHMFFNDCVTLIWIRRDLGNGHKVFEPTNTYLQSTEDGPRFHRSMSTTGMYDGPLDLTPWGEPIAGPVSNDIKWVVNPVHPTREMSETTSPPIQHGEHHNMFTPTGEAIPLGAYTASTPQDVDIPMVAESGQAITRGSANIPVPSAARASPKRTVQTDLTKLC